MARPKKYSPEAVTTILAAVRGGNTLSNAARLAGIHYDTFNEWRKRYAEFSEAVDRAEAEAEAVYVEDIGHASRRGNVAATVFWLERRRSGEWRKPAERVEVDYRRDAEAIAAEIGRPELVPQIEADLLLQVVGGRR